jgi:hypothetical protein
MEPVAVTLAAVAGLFGVPFLLSLARLFGLYAVVPECTTQVFTLFGKVIGSIEDAGLHFPVKRFGSRALIVPFFGKRFEVSTALRQSYLRN